MASEAAAKGLVSLIWSAGELSPTGRILDPWEMWDRSWADQFPLLSSLQGAIWRHKFPVQPIQKRPVWLDSWSWSRSSRQYGDTLPYTVFHSAMPHIPFPHAHCPVSISKNWYRKIHIRGTSHGNGSRLIRQAKWLVKKWIHPEIRTKLEVKDGK